MPVTPSADDREQLEQLTAAWEEYDRTRDVSAVVDFLAEDVMFMPPGSSPVEGKEAALGYLERPNLEPSPELDQWAENIYVSGDLAVVHVSVATVSDDADESVDKGHKGLDVYRREEDGSWKQIITIWNDQI